MDVFSLPKAEIHCHLEGIVDGTIARLIRADNPDFPVDPDALDQHPPFNTMAGFFDWFEHQRALMGNLAAFHPILAAHVERLKQQNVRYTEIMIGVGRMPSEPEPACAAVAALRTWIDQCENNAIQVEFIAAIGRNRTPEAFAQIVEKVLALHEAGLIVGAALAGPEPGYPVKPLHATFVRYHDAGLKIEIHAGEWVGPESVRDALDYGFPNRIGHGVALFQDHALLDEVIARQIHVEMCPTSNVKTGSVATIAQHPIRQALDLGLNFSINTDDPGAFGCSMNGEYELLAEELDFTRADFERVYANTLAARFQPDLRITP